MSNLINTYQITKYKDFDLTFSAHPVSGDVSVLSHENSVKQSLQNLVRLNFYDVSFQPSIGSNISAILFEQINSTTLSEAAEKIKSTIVALEPRIEVIDIRSEIDNTDPNTIRFEIEYYMKNDPSPQSTSVVISNSR